MKVLIYTIYPLQACHTAIFYVPSGRLMIRVGTAVSPPSLVSLTATMLGPAFKSALSIVMGNPLAVRTEKIGKCASREFNNYWRSNQIKEYQGKSLGCRKGLISNKPTSWGMATCKPSMHMCSRHMVSRRGGSSHWVSPCSPQLALETIPTHPPSHIGDPIFPPCHGPYRPRCEQSGSEMVRLHGSLTIPQVPPIIEA